MPPKSIRISVQQFPQEFHSFLKRAESRQRYWENEDKNQRTGKILVGIEMVDVVILHKTRLRINPKNKLKAIKDKEKMIHTQLAKLESEGKRIRVGLVGAGRFGTSIVSQVSRIKGMDISIIADINPQKAIDAYSHYGVEASEICETHCVSVANQKIENKKAVITTDSVLVTRCMVDVVVEATGVPDSGAIVAYNAILHGKHIVMVNVETDVLLGRILKRLADSAGVVYTITDGDQPGVIMGMYDWAMTLGFDVIAAGRGTKRYPFDREGTPEGAFERFGYSEGQVERMKLNPRMYNSFRDGTKAQIEMASVANMTGLVPDVRGMHEPSVSITALPTVFSLKKDGGILGREGVVELANCIAADGQSELPANIAIGVFVVITSPHPFTQEDMAFYGLHVSTDHKNGLIYRPYHLCGIEAPRSIAKAALVKQATGAPIDRPVADVITVARKNLTAGEILDGSGGYTVRGLIERAEIVQRENLLPLGLAYGVPVTRDIAKGESITYDMVALDESSFALKLRRLQDAEF